MKCFKVLGILLLFFVFSGQLFAQNKITLTGQVISASDNSPIIGATVMEEHTTNGIMTDFDGNFTIKVEEGSNLAVSFVGMKTFSQNVSLFEDLSKIVIELQDAVMDLDDVVVIGYGVQKKSTVTGAISSIDSKDMEKLPVQRAEQALQGKVAGVAVASSSGQPGATVAVSIRGVGTTGNSQPLYIVDGSPSGDISYLAASDISNMEVLKDAAASSIYGARGANGVIIITTKKGAVGELKVSYDGYVGVQRPARTVDMMNAEEYAVVMNDAYYRAGYDTAYVSNETLAKIGTEGTDWQKELFSTNAIMQNHSVTMSGGSDKATQSVSLSYLSQEGIVSEDKSKYERFNGRINLNQKAYDDRLNTGLSLVYSHIRSQGVDANGEYDSPTGHALNMDPLTSVYNEDGSFGMPYNPGMQEIVNPLGKLYYLHDSYRTDKVVANLFAQYEIVPNLKFRSNIGIDFSYQTHDTYTPIYYLSSIRKNETSDVSKSINRWYTYNWENTLTYSKTFDKKHDFTALIGTSAVTSKWEDLGGSGSELTIDTPDNAYLSNIGNIESMSTYGSASENSLLSAFGRVNYAYANKYLASVTMRYDGSSRFGANNRFAFFPSVSTGWVVSEENFLNGRTGSLAFIKLRASWGQNGNENIGDFNYLSSISNDNNYNWDTGSPVNGSAPTKVSNPDLRWETSEQLDLGFDLRFDNGLYSTFDYYVKTTKDLLITAPIPGYVGNNPPTVNGGTVKNNGMEFLLGYDKRSGDFTYGASLNLTTNKNEMTAINNDEGRLYGANVGPSGLKNITMAEVGQPIGFFWGLETDGVFQTQQEVDAHAKDGELIQKTASAGDFRYVDQNGDGEINDNDRIYLGDPHANFTYGINLNLGYKGFDMNMFFYGVAGNQIIDATRRYDLSAANFHTDYIDRWTGAGSTNDMPQISWDDSNGNFSRFSDFMVKDANYFRLKNLQVGYTLPETALEKICLESARFYVSGENLFTITGYKGYDPEIGSTGDIFQTGIDKGVYPKSTMFSFGMNLKF